MLKDSYNIDKAIELIAQTSNSSKDSFVMLSKGKYYTIKEAGEKGIKGVMIRNKSTKEIEREIKKVVFGKSRVTERDIQNLKIVLDHLVKTSS